jgi:predicted ATP-grasp superfamily ATP-dependent carboligase
MKQESAQTEIIIVGASARACAQSLNLCGLTPYSVDLFCDQDTQDAGPTARILQFPWDIPELIAENPGKPVMLTGGMENHPLILEEISQSHPALYCRSSALKSVKNPVELQSVLAQAELPNLRIHPGSSPPLSGIWLKKPLHSAGGQKIAFWNISGRNIIENDPEEYYFQEYLPGASFSATCLGVPDQAGVSPDKPHGVVLGLTRQLIGEEWSHAPAFSYCGSIGPIRLSEESERLIEKLAHVIAKQFEIRGLFGIDLVLDKQGIPHVVEVNPRYTASMEIFERLMGSSLLKLHFAAYGWDPSVTLETWVSDLTVPISYPKGYPEAFWNLVQQTRNNMHRATGMMGKVVLFASQPLVVKDNWSWDNYLATSFGTNKNECMQVADRPRAGVFVGTEDPICTLIVRGETESHTYDTLRRRAVMMHSDLLMMW